MQSPHRPAEGSTRTRALLARAAATAVAGLALVAPAVASADEGVLDPNFGDNGFAMVRSTDVTGLGARTAALTRTGKLVAVGTGGRPCSTNNCPFWERRILVTRHQPLHGELDTTFGNRGKVVLDLPNVTREDIRAAVVQEDGKILLAGTGNSGGPASMLVRLHANGVIDKSFGKGGVVVTRGPDGLDQQINAVRVLRNGKIVAAGTVSGRNPQGSDELLFHHVLLARFNSNGTLDTSFGEGGEVTNNTAEGTANELAIDNFGRLVVAGAPDSPQEMNNSADFEVARYTSDGALDPSFGTGGSVVVGFGGATGTQVSDGTGGAKGLALLSDGRIAVAGAQELKLANNDFSYAAVAMMTSTGAPDESFDADGNTDGKELIDLGTQKVGGIGSLVLNPRSGKLVLGGSNKPVSPGRHQPTVARLTLDGHLDSTFGEGGVAHGPDFELGGGVSALLRERTGNLIAAGTKVPGGDPGMFVARYRQDNEGCSIVFGCVQVTATQSGAEVAAQRLRDAIKSRIEVDLGEPIKPNRNGIGGGRGRTLPLGKVMGGKAKLRINKSTLKGAMPGTYQIRLHVKRNGRDYWSSALPMVLPAR